jgi:hypothetical protein
VPFIPAKPGDWDDLALATFRLFLYPKNFDETVSLEREAMAKGIGLVIDLLGARNIAIGDEELTTLRETHPGTPPVVTNNLTNLRDAFVAGQILVKALRLVKVLPDKASIANAMKIVSYGFRTGRHPLGSKALMAIWGRYKGLSHLSGAFYAKGKVLTPIARIFDIVRAMPHEKTTRPDREYSEREKKALAEFYEIFLFKPFRDALGDSYPQLFAAAEELRCIGETNFARGQKVIGRPILMPGEAWSIPPGFILPETSIDYGPAITDLEKRILLKSK